MAEGAVIGGWLRRALVGLTLLAALVLFLAAAGLIPAREPQAPESEPFAVRKAIAPEAPFSRAEQPPAQPRGKLAQSVSFVPLCEAPERGARLLKLDLFAAQEALLVWCKQGYELFRVEPAAAAPTLTRVARFKTHGELPGGAAAGDFDADGQTDLVLGVATRAGVVHRSGVGVYLVRGRAQGGFESPRALAEIGSVAIAAHPSPDGRGHELLVLTAGDVAAQRPGELWLFGREPLLSRQRVLPAALDPRGLALRAGAEPNLLEAWLLSGQPGRLDRVLLDLTARAARPEQAVSLALRGAQTLAHEPAHEGALFVRDATNLYRVERAPAPRLALFAERAHVGPFALADLDADRKPEVLAATETGVAWLKNGESEPSERELPSELKVLDVETLRGSVGAVRPVALAQGRPDASTLSLLLLPSPPWPSARAAQPELVFTRVELGTSASVAELTLE